MIVLVLVLLSVVVWTAVVDCGACTVVVAPAGTTGVVPAAAGVVVCAGGGPGGGGGGAGPGTVLVLVTPILGVPGAAVV